MRVMVLLLLRVIVSLFVRPALVRDAVVFSLAAVYASAERIFSQIVSVHAVPGSGAVHCRWFNFRVVRSVSTGRPSSSVSVQRLRAAEQTSTAIGGRSVSCGSGPHAVVVTPVGVTVRVVIVIVVVVAFVATTVVIVIIIVAVPVRASALFRRRFWFFPILLPVRG